MAEWCVIPGLSQSVHHHPADSSFNFQPAQNPDFEPEVTTWNNLVGKNPTTQQQIKKVAFHLDRHINYDTLHERTGSPHPRNSQTEDKMSYRTKLTLKHTALSAQVDGGRAVSPWTANIALTLAEQTDLRSFYQHKLGPKCRARGPELQQTDC